jgi:drug/metabolite transporter (DMT)-like permease
MPRKPGCGPGFALLLVRNDRDWQGMDGGETTGSPRRDRPLAGVAANTVSFAAASVGDALSKLVVAVVPTAQAIGLRSLFLLLLFAPVFAHAMSRGAPIFATGRPMLHLARIALHGVSTVAAFSALPYLSLTTYTTISFIAPIFIALAAIPMLGERLKPYQVGAIALGFAGCAIVLRPTGEGETAFMALALLSAAAWAMSVPLLRLLTRTESRVTLLAWSNAPLMVAAIVVALFDWRPIEISLLIVIAATSALQIVGQLFSMTALRLAPAATVAPVQYTQILWASLIGLVMFNEWPKPDLWIGAAFIVAGGLWLMRGGRAA